MMQEVSVKQGWAGAALLMVVCAPLLNYFGHAVESVVAGLGVVVMLAWCGVYARGTRWRPVVDRETLAVILAVAAALGCWGISSAMGIRPEKALGSWYTVVGIVAALAVFGALARRLPVGCHRVGLMVVAGLTCGLAALVLVERFVPALSQVLHGAVASDRLHFAGPILVWGLPFVVLAMLNDRRYAVGVLLVMVAIAAGGGRTGWVVAPVELALFALLCRRAMRPMAWLALAVGMVCAFGVGLALLGLSEGPQLVQARTADLMAAQGTGRVDIWRFALEQWWSHDVWWGIGVQGFRYLDFSQVVLNSTAHPHNSVVQLLLETGIIGLVTGLLAAAAVCALAWQRLAPAGEVRAALATCLAGLAGCSLFSTSLFHGWWVLFMLVPLAWALGWPVKVAR